MRRYKLILSSMAFLVVIMCVFTIASLTQQTPTFVINTTTSSVNDVLFELNEMSNGLSDELITFSGSETVTRNFNMPFRSTVTSATINITGIKKRSLRLLHNITVGDARLGAEDLVVKDNIGYVVDIFSEQLLAFNLTNASNIVLIDNISTSFKGAAGSNSEIIVSNKSILFFAQSGITAYNVSDLSDMRIFQSTDKGAIFGMDLVGNDTLYAADAANDVLSVYNVSNPDNLVELGNISGAGAPNYLDTVYDVRVVGDIAYVIGGNDDSLVLFNISNASNIILLDSIIGAGSPNFLESPRDIFVDGDVAYVAAIGDDSLSLFNISNPNDISFISKISGEGSPYFLDSISEVYVKNDLVYLTSTADVDGNGLTDEGVLAIYNATNKSSLSLVDMVSNTGTLSGARSPFVDEDGVIFLLAYFDNFILSFNNSPSFPLDVKIDIGDDGSYEFSHSGELGTENTTSELKIAINEYITSTGNESLKLLDSIQQNLESVDVLFVSNNSIAYTIGGGNVVDRYLVAFDVSQKGNIVLLDFINESADCNPFAPDDCLFGGLNINDLFVDTNKNILYFTSENNLYLFNVSNANNLEFISNSSGIVDGAGIFASLNPTAIHVQNDSAFIAFGNNESIYVLNVSDNNDISVISSVEGAGAPNYLDGPKDMTIVGDVLYVASSEDDGISTWNITNLSNIVLMDNLLGFSDTRELEIMDDIAYVSTHQTVAGGNRGILFVINVTNSSNLVMLSNITYDSIFGSNSHNSGGLSGDLSNNYLYVVSGQNDHALAILNVIDPISISVISTISGTGTPNFLNGAFDVVFKNGVAFVISWIEDALSSFELTSNFCVQNFQGLCDVEFDIESDGGGVNISGINITYNYNATYLFTRDDTLTWNTTSEILAGAILNRRYSVIPTVNLSSNNITVSGYYLRNDTATQCQVNNEDQTVTANYCALAFTVNRSDLWPTHFIWDNNITNEKGVNWTNQSFLISEVLYENHTLDYLNPDISTAASGLFTNTTVQHFYNKSITDNEKLEFWDGSSWVDITTTNTCPDYERKTTGSRVFYVCLNTTEQFVSFKVESSN